MPDKLKLAILDNSDYAEYFLRLMKDDYMPVTLNDATKSVLEARGIKAVGILDYLGFDVLKNITTKAFLASNLLLSELDAENRDAYLDIFGSTDIRFFDVTIGYLFKRFAIASLRLVSGLEAILKHHRIDEIAYLHDGQARIMCGTKKERGFSFPDDISWEIIQRWEHKDKPILKFVKAERELSPAESRISWKVKCLDCLRKVKALLYPIKLAALNYGKRNKPYSPDKQTLLFMSPLYDFKPVLESGRLNRDYNVLLWDADRRINREEARGATCRLSFKADNFIDDSLFDNIDFKGLVMPLIKKFYENKLADILSYWREAVVLSQTYGIALVLWGNSPHRYPNGLIAEYFRLKGVPICGMQHGGSTGSNNLEESILETDFNHCDYYFSYGFGECDMDSIPGMRRASIVPAGSAVIRKAYDQYGILNSKRKRIDILFPISLAVGEFYYENEFSYPGLFEFQKKIVDILAGSSGKKILLKFPVGALRSNPLAFYIEKKYPGKFMVTDRMSFVGCLSEFEPETILIEEQSTPLNEAIVTRSNIIVHNNDNWAGLTKTAIRILSKRAVVCEGEEAFLGAVGECIKGSIIQRNLENTEFLEKYCVYKGNPEENIEGAIRFIASKRTLPDRRGLVYAK